MTIKRKLQNDPNGFDPVSAAQQAVLSILSFVVSKFFFPFLLILSQYLLFQLFLSEKQRSGKGLFVTVLASSGFLLFGNVSVIFEFYLFCVFPVWVFAWLLRTRHFTPGRFAEAFALVHMLMGLGWHVYVKLVWTADVKQKIVDALKVSLPPEVTAILTPDLLSFAFDIGVVGVIAYFAGMSLCALFFTVRFLNRKASERFSHITPVPVDDLLWGFAYPRWLYGLWGLSVLCMGGALFAGLDRGLLVTSMVLPTLAISLLFIQGFVVVVCALRKVKFFSFAIVVLILSVILLPILMLVCVVIGALDPLLSFRSNIAKPGN